MKKNLLAIVLCFITVSIYAQRTETLFNNARARGAFGAVITEFGTFNSDLATSVGGGGGIILDNFFIGAYGMGTTNIQTFEDNGILDMGHGGFWVGFTTPHYKVIHLFASAKAGWGALDLDVDNFRGSDNIFVLTPEVGAELNLLTWIKVAGTVGYRNVTRVADITGQKNEDFSGMIGTVTFRIGAFGRWREHRRGRDRDRHRHDD